MAESSFAQGITLHERGESPRESDASAPGIRYMFATECSKPAATKAETGKRTASTLSPVLRAPIESQTARQTSTLQRTPRNRARSNGRATLATESNSTMLATEPSPDRYCPESRTRTAV